MRGALTWTTLTAACCLAGRAAEPQFVFVENGRAKCALVASEGVQRLDLDCFTNAVFRCTGAKMEILKKAEGEGEERNHVVFSVEERSVLAEDDYEVTFPDSRTMKILGSADSCRWALNRILEDAFGVVFCLPGKYGTHYPAKRSVSIPAVGWSDKPVYQLERDDEGSMDPAWKRCLNAKYFERVDTGGHNLRSIFGDPKYRDPAWVAKLMPQINGVREYPKNIVKLWEPCFACKEGVDEAVAYLSGQLRANPKRKWVSLGVNDCGGFCECDGCKAMNGGSVTARCKFDRNYPSFANAYGRWCNQIAERLEKEFPSVMIGFIAYRELIDPPDFKLHRNLVPAFCVETLQWMDDDNRVRFTELFDAWAKVCSQFMISDYAYGSSYKVPRVYNRLLQSVLSAKLTKWPALNGWRGECGVSWQEGPKFWLHFKLLWKPDVDLDRTLDTWYRACAGDEAAPYLKEYYDLWEQFWFTPAVKETQWYKYTCHFVYFWFTWQQYLYALDAARVERCAKLTTLALEAAERSGTPDQKLRMRKLAAWHRQAVADAFAGGAGAVTNPQGSIKTPEDVALFEKGFPRMQRCALESIRCFDRITEYLEDDCRGIADTPKWRCHLGISSRKAGRGSGMENRIRLVNQYLGFKNAAADPTGRNYVAKDAALAGENAVVAAGEAGGWSVTATGKAPAATTVVATDPDVREYFATVTVRNTTSHKLRFSIGADTWSVRNRRAFNDPRILSGEAEPGKASTVNVLMNQTRNAFSGETAVFLKVSFANLRPGETAAIESLSLRRSSPRALRLDASATPAVKQDREKVNTMTYEDRQDL